MNAALPFVGRAREVAWLQRLHAGREHGLIVGPAGVGKSALISHTGGLLPLLICPQSERLSEICASLESHLGMETAGQRLIPRKNRLLRVLAERRRTIVFDGVGWTTPKLSAFLECVSQRVPVWILTRSEHPWDIGRVWPLVARFARVELHPFHLAQTRALVEVAVSAGHIPAGALDAVERLHHLSAGNPGALRELLDGLATGDYDPRKLFDLKLLDLDRRIKQLPSATDYHAART